MQHIFGWGKKMDRILKRVAIALMLVALSPMTHAASDQERSVQEIRFEQGRTSTVIKGSIKGYHYVDYQLRAGAGQTLKASMHGSNGANYFNIISPGAGDVAMYIGHVGSNTFEGVLPVEGVYTLRVYLMRSAARRNETSHYTLDVAVTGKPLQALPDDKDARIPGTLYHASATISCALPYEPDTKRCEALVIRRGFDGTATVEVRGTKSYLRRILFVGGKPVASDSAEPMSTSRRGDVTEVSFGKDERLEIVDALITGG